MTDRTATRASSLTGPAAQAFAIIPDDDIDLGQDIRALYVGSSGSISVVMASGAEALFEGLSSGTVLPIRARRVLATGTTAGAIVGLA